MATVKRIDSKVKVFINDKWYDVKDQGQFEQELYIQVDYFGVDVFSKNLDQGIEISDDLIVFEKLATYVPPILDDPKSGKWIDVEYAILKTIKEEDNQDELWCNVILKVIELQFDSSDKLTKYLNQFKITKK